MTAPDKTRLPRTRGDCPAERPCAHFSCRHNLSVNIRGNGSITWVTGYQRGRVERFEKRRQWPQVFGISRERQEREAEKLVDELFEWWSQFKTNCALDIAEEGGATLEDIGELLGLTRERVRQIETDAQRKLKRKRWDGATEG